MVQFNHSILSQSLLATHAYNAPGSVINGSHVTTVGHSNFKVLAYSNLQKEYFPSTFFNDFDFFTDNDPTNGFVDFIDFNTASSMGIVSAPADNSAPVYIGVDHDNVVQGGERGRKSVRLVSKDSYNHGLFILDLDHMPVGCGTWPAFWTVGPDWPHNGEIDVIEGVHNQNWDNSALHTAPGCGISGSGATTEATTFDCNTAVDNNVGCAFHDTNSQSYGKGLNSVGGGIYAMEWNSQFIKVWFFPRGSIPADATGPNPAPENWGTPAAFFQGCDIDSFFHNQQIVFDITFCGDWAGDSNVWAQSGCASQASTCNSFVANQPNQFGDAYWIINSLKVFSS